MVRPGTEAATCGTSRLPAANKGPSNASTMLWLPSKVVKTAVFRTSRLQRGGPSERAQ